MLLVACSSKEETPASNEINLVKEELNESTFEENKDDRTDKQNTNDETLPEQGQIITKRRHLPLIADTDIQYRSILADIYTPHQLSFHNNSEHEFVRLSLINYKTEREYTLTADYPILIQEENFEIIGGEIIGDIIIDAPGFKMDGFLDGQLSFTKEEYKETAHLENLKTDQEILVTGERNLEAFQNHYNETEAQNASFELDEIVNGELQLDDNDKLLEEKYNFKYQTDIGQGHVH